MRQNQVLKPIIFFGYCLVFIALLIIPKYYFSRNSANYIADFFSFEIIVSLFHLIVGVGVILKLRYGYYSLKIYLYILSVGFPIGTYIAIKTLKYIEKNRIKDYFE